MAVDNATGRLWPAPVPEAVRQIVEVAHPVRIVLFGSVARGDADAETDLDVLVVVDQVTSGPQRREWMRRIRRAITVDAPVDVVVTDLAECARRGDIPGSVHHQPLREGRIVYERAV